MTGVWTRRRPSPNPLPMGEGTGRWHLWRLLALLLRVLANFVRSLWQMRPILGLATAVAIAVPWFVWAGLRTGGQAPYEFLVGSNLLPFRQAIQGTPVRSGTTSSACCCCSFPGRSSSGRRSPTRSAKAAATRPGGRPTSCWPAGSACGWSSGRSARPSSPTTSCRPIRPWPC